RPVGRADGRRALERHVLEHVREAGLAGVLVDGADVHAVRERDHRRVVPLEHEDPETVRQQDLLDLAGELIEAALRAFLLRVVGGRPPGREPRGRDERDRGERDEEHLAAARTHFDSPSYHLGGVLPLAFSARSTSSLSAAVSPSPRTSMKRTLPLW